MIISGIGSTAGHSAATGQQAAIQALQTTQETAKTQANALLELLQTAAETTESHAKDGGGHGLDVHA